LPGNPRPAVRSWSADPGAEKSAYSVNHGAGRCMDARPPIARFDQKTVDDEFVANDILTNCASIRRTKRRRLQGFRRGAGLGEDRGSGERSCPTEGAFRDQGCRFESALVSLRPDGPMRIPRQGVAWGFTFATSQVKPTNGCGFGFGEQFRGAKPGCIPVERAGIRHMNRV